LLGLPPADRPQFIAWMNSFTRLTGAIGFLGLIPAMVRHRAPGVPGHAGEGTALRLALTQGLFSKPHPDRRELDEGMQDSVPGAE
jgi:hypothetical protein